jgi:hypothetical protein
MKLKSTARIKEINKYGLQFFAACLAYEHQYHDELVDDELTITSANDSEHGAKGSYHYIDQAWDLRTRDKTKGQTAQLASFLKRELGYGWDVVIEKDHIHVERDTRNYPDNYPDKENDN